MGTLSLGVFPGSFNPLTTAHLALMQAALPLVDQVIAVIPEKFPHKSYSGVSLDDRLAMLEAARTQVPYSVRVTRGGLFVEMARELREEFGSSAEVWMICGRDAAQRIVEWDYGEAEAIHRILEEFGLLVASRLGRYEAPARIAPRIRSLAVPPEIDDVSATEVRRRIEAGEPWEHLVPEPVHPIVRRVYGPLRGQSTSG